MKMITPGLADSLTPHGWYDRQPRRGTGERAERRLHLPHLRLHLPHLHVPRLHVPHLRPRHPQL